jgi:hypothetical protein
LRACGASAEIQRVWQPTVQASKITASFMPTCQTTAAATAWRTYLGSACRAATAALVAALAASIASCSFVGPSRGLGGGFGLWAAGMSSGCGRGLGRGCVRLKGWGIVDAAFCCRLLLPLLPAPLLPASPLSYKASNAWKKLAGSAAFRCYSQMRTWSYVAVCQTNTSCCQPSLHQQLTLAVLLSCSTPLAQPRLAFTTAVQQQAVTATCRPTFCRWVK